MTNKMIIFWESVNLMEQGVLESIGEVATVDGKTVQVPEEIHTYAAWKAMGYQVKKGEHAVAAFPVWKHTTRTKKNEQGEDEEKSSMFMKTAHFFKRAQVESIVKGGE